LRDFWFEAQNKSKKYARENVIPGLNDMAVWKDFWPPYILEKIWAEYIQHVMSKRFARRSPSSVGNQSRQIHGSVTIHTGDSVPFFLHAK
jgi:hypothetical protein